jgi:hypothetical protein
MLVKISLLIKVRGRPNIAIGYFRVYAMDFINDGFGIVNFVFGHTLI